jgi:hypothetical protein
MTAPDLTPDLSAMGDGPFGAFDGPPLRSLTRLGRPWGTMAGALLWAIGVCVAVWFPAVIFGQLGQGVGVAVVAFGVVGATADFVNNVPYLRLRATSPWYVALSLSGGVFYAITCIAAAFLPLTAARWLRPCGALSVVFAVIGWRLWIYSVIRRSD